jgi:hypothetical protein
VPDIQEGIASIKKSQNTVTLQMVPGGWIRPLYVSRGNLPNRKIHASQMHPPKKTTVNSRVPKHIFFENHVSPAHGCRTDTLAAEIFYLLPTMVG